MASTIQHGFPRNLFFDLDGTLLDSLPGIRHSVSAAFAACGLEMGKADLATLIGPPIRTILANISAVTLDEAQLDRLVAAFRESYDTEGWKLTPHYAEAATTLQELRAQGRRLFVVSNKPRHISEKILAEERTLDSFEEIVTRDTREPWYADKREMLLYLLRKWHFAPDSCLMIGDTIEDASSSHDVGIPFCLMTHGYGGEFAEPSVPVAFRFGGFTEFALFASQEGKLD
jgi:phosphoglycolate phosphatase